MYFAFNEGYLHNEVESQKEIKYLDKIMLPVDLSLSKNEHTEFYDMGDCIVMLLYRERHVDNSFIHRINKFINEHKLDIRGDIIIDNVIDCFITRNPKEELYEIIIPLK